jgi:hypothetical protein
MRRSCQRKAVGSSEDPDSLYLAADAFCSDDNNENNKINATEVRLIEDDDVVKTITTY